MWTDSTNICVISMRLEYSSALKNVGVYFKYILIIYVLTSATCTLTQISILKSIGLLIPYHPRPHSFLTILCLHRGTKQFTNIHCSLTPSILAPPYFTYNNKKVSENILNNTTFTEWMTHNSKWWLSTSLKVLKKRLLLPKCVLHSSLLRERFHMDNSIW